MREVLIIGSGFAGSFAARLLTELGIDVLVVDKGRRPGGRTSTRRFGIGGLDHGGIRIDARPAWFAQRAASMVASGLLTTTGSLIGGADRIPTMWLEDVDLIQRTEVERLEEREDGWTARTRDGRCLDARSIISTAPFPQLLGMLGSVTVPGQHPTYMPTWTVMVEGTSSPRHSMASRASRRCAAGSSSAIRGSSCISPSRRANDDLRRPPRRWQASVPLRLKQEWVEGAAWLEESVARAHRWRYGRARSGATCDRIGPRLFLAGDAHGPVPGTVGASLASAACAVDRILTDVLMRPGLAFLESGWQPVTELAEVGE